MNIPVITKQFSPSHFDRHLAEPLHVVPSAKNMNPLDARINVTRLGNTNYQAWKFKTEMLLSRDDLWGVVTESAPSPITPDWTKKNRQAMATISLTVEDSQLIHIRKHSTAAGMWEALRKIYERSNMTSKLYLYRKLYGSRLEGDQDMATHVNNTMEIVEKLRDSGEDLKDRQIAAILLCSVPETYGSLITALEARPEEDLSLEYVVGKLIDEQKRRKENGNQETQAKETVLKTQTNKGRQKRETRSCYYCGNVGHFKRDCRIRAGQNASSTPHHKAKAAEDHVKENKEIEESESNRGEFVCFSISDTRDAEGWYIDSGATSHMTSNKNFFSDLKLFLKPDKVAVADGREIDVLGSGYGFLKREDCKTDSVYTKSKLIKLENVLYVPKLDGNLISVKRLAQLGYEITFIHNSCSILKGKEVLARAILDNNLYRLKYTHKALSIKECIGKECIHLWHRRLGHRNTKSIWKLINENMCEGLKLSKCNTMRICEDCIKGKATSEPFPKHSLSRATKPFDLIHSDLCGPMRTPSVGGAKYMATFIDDYSRYTEVILLKNKSDLNQGIMDYIEKWKNVFQRKPLKIRTDGGGEYLNNELSIYLKRNGIQRQVTVPHSPQQNGTAERKNRSLLEMTRCMLFDANLGNEYWGEALNTANYIQNRLPTAPCDRTPYELWHGTKPRLGHIKVFGCKAYSKINGQNLSKLDSRTNTGVLLGYSEESKGYRILNKETGKCSLSRDVTFDETPSLIGHSIIHNDTETSLKPQTYNDSEIIEEGDKSGTRRSERWNKGIPPKKYAYKAESHVEIEPTSWSDLLKLESGQYLNWKTAMDEEIKAFKDNNTWTLTALPPGKKAIGNKWTYKLKYNQDGEITQRKARLVAKGYNQSYGEDFNETFAPVMRYSTLRMLISIAASKNMKTRHMDVKSAFLNGKLQEEIYMEQPQGYIDPKQQNLVCKLNKTLYGLKQSAHEWNSEINETLTKQGYTKGNADMCLYAKQTNRKWTYILIYVDDLLMCSNDADEMNHIQLVLNQTYEMKDLGEVSHFLGIEIRKLEDGRYTLSQTNKIKLLLKKYDLETAKETPTPMEPDFLRANDDHTVYLSSNENYRHAVGALLHISTVTRPDISASVGFLGRKVSKPSQSDWNAVKKLLKYLKTTINTKLTIKGMDKNGLMGYVDADWAGDCNDRKSTSGYLFKLNGDLITWCSRKQGCVALSSTEAEFVAAATACQEILWLKQLLKDFGHNDIQMQPTKLLEDNQGCLKLISTDKPHNRSKHIDIKYHLIKDLANQGVIEMEYCPTEKMVADILTKPLGKLRHRELTTSLGMHEFTS